MLGLAAAVYPQLLAVVVVILTRPRPRPLLWACYLGSVCVGLGCGIALLAIFRSNGSVAGTSSNRLGPSAYLVIGVITVAVAIFAYQQIKNHFLYPVVVGRAVSLGSLLVLVSVLAGAQLAGIGGAVMAIPIAGVLNAFIVEIARYRAAKRAEEIASDIVQDPPPAPPKQPGRMRATATRMRDRRAARKAPKS